ncbi:MAG TPA: hypothetical protein VFF73_34665 [Planctomycetota bacterium]|nr:hypothetical protein [Planctomycetota bacterium]
MNETRPTKLVHALTAFAALAIANLGGFVAYLVLMQQRLASRENAELGICVLHEALYVTAALVVADVAREKNLHFAPLVLLALVGSLAACMGDETAIWIQANLPPPTGLQTLRPHGMALREFLLGSLGDWHYWVRIVATTLGALGAAALRGRKPEGFALAFPTCVATNAMILVANARYPEEYVRAFAASSLVALALVSLLVPLLERFARRLHGGDGVR